MKEAAEHSPQSAMLGLDKNRQQLLKLKRTSPLNYSGEDPNRLPPSQCAVVDLRNSCVRS